MRLRKLILSTGLAVAMVATSIPAIAGTPANGGDEKDGWSYNGITINALSDDSTLGSALNVSDSLTVGDWTGTKKSTVATLTNPTSAGGTQADQNVADNVSSIKKDLDSNELAAAKAINFSPITAKTTYEFALSKTISWEATDAKAMTDNEIKADIEANKATLTKDIIEEALGKGYIAATPVKVSVNIDLSSVKNGTDPVTDNGEVTTPGTKASCTASITAKYTAVITTEETSLPSGYTYDIVKDKDASKAYVLYQYNVAEDTFEKVSLTDVNDGDSIKYAVTDLSKAYILASKTVSATGALLFAPTTGADSDSAKVTSGDDIVATIEGGTLQANTADYTKATNAPESATVAGYFTINVTKAGAPVSDLGGATLEFKIAVPTNVTPSEGKKINWMVVRTHNGEVDILPATEVDGYIVFSTGYFSDYALIYTEVAADAETPADPTADPETPAADPETPAGEDTQAPTTTTAGGTSTTSKTSSSGTADNSMMPIVVVSLLLALCAGSVAVYKEKKTL